jgi:hypothetical protein
MRKGLVVLAVSAIVAVVAVSGASAKNTECNTPVMTALTGTIEGNVIVPEGAFCLTVGATITGNVLVQEGAVGFHAHNSTIGGHVYSERPIVFDIRILDSEVGGNVHISRTRSGSAVAICRSHIGGNVHWTDNEGFQTIGIGFPADVCTAGNTIEGSVVLDNNSGPVNFNMNNNVVRGGVHAMNNRGSETIARNTIEGVLVCEGNEPPPVSAGNTAKSFQGQCQN